MKICLAQIRPVKGAIEPNINNHLKLVDLALLHQADVVLFPELSLTGYEPELAGTLAIAPDNARLNAFQEISTLRRVMLGIGAPVQTGAGVSIALVIFQPERGRQLYTKQYLHPDEEPYFVSHAASPGLLAGTLALAICYELSVPEHAAAAHEQGANFYVACVAKSAEGVKNAEARLAEIATTYGMMTLMVNCVGYCDTFESGGKSAVWNSKGQRLGQLPADAEGILLVDTATQEISLSVL